MKDSVFNGAAKPFQQIHVTRSSMNFLLKEKHKYNNQCYVVKDSVTYLLATVLHVITLLFYELDFPNQHSV